MEPSDRAWLFAEMGRRGFLRIDAEFSGGGDEGGLEQVQVETVPGVWSNLDEDDRLEEILAGLMYEYYSGDGAGVYGSIAVDRDANAILINASVEEYVEQTPIEL